MSGNDRATRVALLAGQGCALGLMMAWILIPASTIFLEEYGPERLPVTYIGAACAGMLSSSALSAALRRKPLAQVATNILVAMAALLVGAWTLLRADAIWVSFALLVLVPIVVPVGFVFIVGQAGALLDVRALKVSYARVVAGFAFGFMLGGLAGPVLLTFLGGTEQLLLAAAGAAGLFLAIVTVARRRYPVELSAVEHDDAAPDTGDPPPTLRTLGRYRYVVLIVGFQMLSAIESQWLDFQVFDRAAQRYSDSEDLARFVSWFSAIAYGADILFLLVLAGLLLSRFGLRYGLTANSISVLVVVLAIIVSTILVGSTASLVFVLVVAARVTDLTFSDGSSRTSLSAAYGALPARLRGVAAATVEGLAVPVAIGISGVVLLVLQSAGSTRGLLLPALTAAVVGTWLLTAVLLYREYRTNLLASLRVRALDTEDVTMAAESGRLVIDRLVHSSDERDVRLGLEILEQQQHPELREQLERLIVDERVRVRADALDRLLRLAPDAAATAARDGLKDPSPDVRAASLRILGTVRDPSDGTRVAACVGDPDGEVRVAVAFALTRIDPDVASGPIGAAITNLVQSPDRSDRVLAARMIGACDSAGNRPDPGALRALLDDPAGDVANAALNALDWSVDVDLRGDVFAHLENRHTVGAAAEALVRMGEPALPFVDEQLRAEGNGDHVRIVLVRVARDIGGPQAAAMLRAHVSDDDRDVGLAVLTALAALGPEQAGTQGELDQLESDVARADLEYATHVLRARTALEGLASAEATRAALEDELELLQHRALAWLSIRHGTAALQRIALQLAQRETPTHALALEWLDVSLSGPSRAVVALLDPGLSDRERLDALTRPFPLGLASTNDILIDLVRDPDRRWRRQWLRACALYTASGIREHDRAAIVAAADDALASVSTDEEGIWTETLAYVRNGHDGS